MPGMQQTLHCAKGGMWNKFHCHCFCGNKFRWHSHPFSYRLPLGNLVLAAAAFFLFYSQLPYRIVECLCACKHCLLQLADLQQPAGLLPGSLHPQRCQGHLFMARWGKNIKLAGDGRCDSAGHCAKYGSYTLMDAETSEVLHTEFVQVRFCCCVI